MSLHSLCLAVALPSCTCLRCVPLTLTAETFTWVARTVPAQLTRSGVRVLPSPQHGPRRPAKFGLVVQLTTQHTGWPGPGPLSPLKTWNGHRFGPLFGRNGPLWEVWGIEISTRDRRGNLISIPIRKKQMNHAVDRPKMHVEKKKSCFKKLLMRIFFRNFGPLIFARKNTGGSKLGFWDPLAHFEVEGRSKFWCGMCHKNSRFYHVLSVSVVSVESVIESVMS